MLVMDQQPMPAAGLPSLDRGSQTQNTTNSLGVNSAMFATAPQTIPATTGQPTAANNGPKAAVVPLVALPSMADDVDLIEKDWVSKVKEVIQKTKYDPYEQARQLAIVKADYLQKRYNKSVKQES